MKKESISVKLRVRQITTERVLIMATLPQLTSDFNRQIKLSNDGGSLSSDTGEFVLSEFDEKIGFSKTLAQHLHVNDERKYHVHSNDHLLRQKIYQIIAGYAENDSADKNTEVNTREKQIAYQDAQIEIR